MASTWLPFLFLLTLSLARLSGGQQPYQPECQSLDDIITQVTENIGMIGSSTCTRRDDCTGASCSISLMSQTFNVRIRLFPCDVPPQMRVLVDGPGISFEETVSSGSTHAIPGLAFPSLPYLPPLGVQLVVRFVPSEEEDGVIVGMDLQLGNTPVKYTLFDDVLILTPPCAMPPNDCDRMQALSDSVPSSCAVRPTPCDGIECSTYGWFDLSTIPIQVEVDTGLRVLSCLTPISLEITARSKDLNLDWTHIFNESDTVPVDQDLTYGAKLVVSVRMTPQIDLENINTTINYTFSGAAFGEFKEIFLENQDVPIPGCREPPPVPTEPPPVNHSECASWKGIENALEFGIENQLAVQDCVTIDGCQGFNCTAIYEGTDYVLLIEEFHCEDPPFVLVSIVGPGQDFTQRFYHNESVDLDTGSSGIEVSVVVHMVPETSTSMYLGVYLIFQGPYGPVKFPLVEDQLLEVSKCEGMTTMVMGSPKTPAQGGGTSQASPRSTGATKRPGKKPDSKPIIKDAVNDPGMSILWTVLLAVFLAIIIASALMGVFIFCRRRQRSNDLAFLMEDTGSSSNERFSSRSL